MKTTTMKKLVPLFFLVLSFALVLGGCKAPVETPKESAPVTTPSPEPTPPPSPGWHQTGWEYIINSYDITLQENDYFVAHSNGLYDYFRGTGGKNDFTVSHWRNNASGGFVAGSTSNSKWQDPPLFIQAGETVVLEASRSYEDNITWGQNGLHIKLDSSELAGAGAATAGYLSFVNTNGENYFHAYEGTVSLEKPMPQGKQGDSKAIWVYLNGYSFKYTYQWRD
ncbi:MAG: hypothetical protein R6W96_03330 [Clostridia bacterium]